VTEQEHISIAEARRRCAESLRHAQERRAQKQSVHTWARWGTLIAFFLIAIAAIIIFTRPF